MYRKISLVDAEKVYIKHLGDLTCIIGGKRLIFQMPKQKNCWQFW